MFLDFIHFIHSDSHPFSRSSIPPFSFIHLLACSLTHSIIYVSFFSFSILFFIFVIFLPYFSISAIIIPNNFDYSTIYFRLFFQCSLLPVSSLCRLLLSFILKCRIYSEPSFRGRVKKERKKKETIMLHNYLLSIT